ncbi:MAG: hypothetical protein E6G14_12920 [Actinobacteria bacterium]|nr:MAG: hypothetical protein E6G14_12920 [Actinomycetota bacterium]
MRRLTLLIGLVGLAVALTAGSANTATSNASYLVFSERSTTASGNGATIDTELSGFFDAGAMTATGSGDYESAAVGDGTFTLTGLITFQFYGCGFVEDIDLGDPTLCGGRVLFAVRFTPDVGAPFDGTIEINCQIHGASNQAPPGTSEGIKINMRGVNFNKHVSGDNVFIQT